MRSFADEWRQVAKKPTQRDSAVDGQIVDRDGLEQAASS